MYLQLGRMLTFDLGTGLLGPLLSVLKYRTANDIIYLLTINYVKNFLATFFV